MKRVRLDRLLANLGYGSRREVQGLIAGGRVRLEGEPLTDAAGHVTPDATLEARLTVNGAPVDPLWPLTLVLHKPLGVVCSHKEPGRSVYDLLPERWRRREPALSTIGRLDRDTSGLLLITDDGALLHRIISPKAHVAKVYRARLEKPLRGDAAALFAAGTLELDGEALKPAILTPLDAQTADLAITEGRYHQVRRMFTAVDNAVVELHRLSIGALALPADLAPGEYRRATEDDIRAAMTSSAQQP